MLVACALTAGLLDAQSAPSRVQPRITAEITNSELSPIQGSLHPLAQPQNDTGRMPPSSRLNGISLYFNRSAAQQADLDALLAAQQNPSSPQFHQWLTPEQFAARFGMAQSDIDKVQSWLQQQGFAIDSVARGRTMIRFSGTVGQVESAFSTQMHYYNVRGAQHFAPSTPLSVPAAIAPVVAGVRNLNDFRPHPMHIRPRAAFTSGSTGNVFFAPGDIAKAYDVGPLTSGGIDGTGQSIAIVGQSSIQLSDIENFQSAAGLTKKDPTQVLVPGTGEPAASTGDQGESDIDLEWSGALAPGANIVFVYVGATTTFSVYDSMQYAIDEKLAPIISMSYASCEPELQASDFTTLESMFSQAATQGQSVFAASGDQGSTACSDPLNTNVPVATQQALAVNYPASSAYVTGVGGTAIQAIDGIDPTTGNKGANYSTYWNAQSGTDVVNSLIKLIPEVVWNDDTISGAVTAQQGGGLSATGGGTSTAIARPSWQTGVPGIPSGSKRLVPDVALYSSPDLPGYLFCTSDHSDWGSSQTGSCGSGFRASTSDSTLTIAGGTSFASPIFASMLALINQKANYTTGQGLINVELYKLAANSSTYASAFHDVTTGNNYCTAGSTYCASNGATLGFKAGTGYDEVTGLGSVDLANLANAWPANSGSSASQMGTKVTVVPANATPTVNTADSFTITVAPASGSGTPTGTVTLQIDGGSDCGGISTTCGGTTVSNQLLSSNGTLTYSATFTTSGSHQVLAQYSGDSTFAASVGAGEVTIGTSSSGKGTIALSPSPSTLTVSRGTSGAETLTVTPAGGYTGTVLLSFTTSNDTALGNLCYSFTNMNSTGQGTLSVTGTAAVTTQLTLDTNASDCASATGGVKTGMHPMHALLNHNATRSPAAPPAPSRLPAETAFAALLLAGFFGRYARRFRAAAWVLVLAAAGLALSACGGGGSGSSVSNPAKGTYTINVTGTDQTTSTITASTSFTFTIN